MSSEAHVYPNSRRAWGMVIVLTIAYMFSFIDRYILGLLIEPIKADLALTDTQIGLLLGLAFAIFYATVGLPLGYLADRKRRTWLVAAGVAVWSLATAASGLAKSFAHLFIARMSVGIGEATLSPCAMSMISDSFPPEKRGRPIAFYAAALSLGAGLASLVSASVLAWAEQVRSIDLPIVGEVVPWQMTFFIVGLPGVLLAIVIFFMREPKRIGVSASDANKSGFFDMLEYVGRRFNVFGSFIAFVCLMTIVAYSQGWYAPLFERTWGWSAKQYALVNGIILLALGPVSVNYAGWLCDKLFEKGYQDAPMRIIIGGALLMVPTAALAPLMPSAELAFVAIAFNTIGIAVLSATSLTALLNITPSLIRGQTVALYYMIISFAGLLLGPTTVGLLSDHVFSNENLKYACAAVPIMFGLPVLLLCRYALRVYNVEYDKHAQVNE